MGTGLACMVESLLLKDLVSFFSLGRMGRKVKVHNLSRVKPKILAVSPVMDNLSSWTGNVLKNLITFSECIKIV